MIEYIIIIINTGGKKLKKLIGIFVIMSACLFGDTAIGFKLGTLNELTFLNNDTQCGIGMRKPDKSGMSTTLDKLYRFDDYYYGIGLGMNTFDDFDWGVRFLMGYSSREEDIEFFAELVPSYYKDEKLRLDTGLGLRVFID